MNCINCGYDIGENYENCGASEDGVCPECGLDQEAKYDTELSGFISINSKDILSVSLNKEEMGIDYHMRKNCTYLDDNEPLITGNEDIFTDIYGCLEDAIEAFSEIQDIKIVSTIEDKKSIDLTIESIADKLIDILRDKKSPFVDIEIIIKKV